MSRKFQLADFPVAVIHRARSVDDQAKPEVGIRFELFDVVTIAPRKDLPVETTQVITNGVGAVFAELNRKPVERTSV